MSSFQKFLEIRLKDSLPGKNAHQIMAPNPIKGKINPSHYEPQHDDFRNSSVLVPVIKQKNALEIVFTLRTDSINHGGQISFPGGGKEGNESIEETALREAQEEIGLVKEEAEIVGRLTPLYVGHSDNMVTPVVAFLNEEQNFTPNPNEVAEIFAVSLPALAAEANLADEEWDLRGMPFKVPFWKIHNVPLWGATAMMLSELVVLYKEFLAES